MTRKGFTLIELLVVIAIIAILAAILFPVFAQAKMAAKKISDLSGMKQIGTSTMLYLSDYDDYFYPHRNNCKVGGNFVACTDYLDASGNFTAAATVLGGVQGTKDYHWHTATDATDQIGTIGDGNEKNAAISRVYWVYMLQPYAKNYDVFSNPGGSGKFTPSSTSIAPACGAFSSSNATVPGASGCIGFGYGGQNSYAHNDTYLSPAQPFNSGTANAAPINSTSVPRVAGTIVLTDGTYYGGGFDSLNESGIRDNSHINGNEAAYAAQLDGSNALQYESYWKNIGNSKWGYSDGATYNLNNDQGSVNLGSTLFGGKVNCQFADGHAKTKDYKQVIGDVCLWTTDADGDHPACN